jgi:mono/diheme cytochrome c family protein
MKRIFLAVILAGAGWGTVRLTHVTYYRDIVPILQEHCLSCHRPDQIAPISFLSYRQTRPWAEAIEHVVLTAKMPPWGGGVPFRHVPVLSIQEVDTIVEWVREGAVAGDPKDAPPPAFEDEAKARRAGFGPYEAR